MDWKPCRQFLQESVSFLGQQDESLLRGITEAGEPSSLQSRGPSPLGKQNNLGMCNPLSGARKMNNVWLRGLRRK